MRALSMLGLSLAIFGSAFSVAAQAPQPAQPSAIIAEIHASGSHHFNDAQVAAATGLKPGDSVTRDQLQAAAERLVQTGVFSRVNYRFTSQGDKITVEFMLEDVPIVPVSFDNFPWFTDEELSAAIREAVPLFDGTAPPDGPALEQMGSAIAKLFPAHGISATVEHTLMTQASSDATMVQFRAEGANVKIGSLEYGDSIAQNAPQLGDRNSDLLGKPFSRFAIEVFENEQVRPLYIAAGHLRVKFGVPIVRFIDDAGQPSPSNLAVSIPIDPGPVFHLSGVTWSGTTVLPETELKSLLAAPPGEIADGIQLTGSWERIEDEYAHRGYLDTKLDPQAQFDDAAATVSFRVAINEGSQYHMGDLVITGLSLTAERVLRAVWKIAPGQVFDKAYFDNLLTKLEKPNEEIFGDLPLHYEKMGNWLRPDAEKHTVDVLLDFQ